MALIAAGFGLADVARLGVALTVLGLWLLAATARRRRDPGPATDE